MADQTLDLFDRLFQEMHTEDAVGLFLAAQLGHTPEEVLCVVQSTLFDRSLGGLRAQHRYVIHAAGLIEHKLSLGMFNTIDLIADHPLLYHHNTPRVRVFLTSKPDAPDDLFCAISKAHTEVYDTWRDLNDDLNPLIQPEQLFAAGYGLLGEMPQPFAEAVSRVCTQYGVQHKLVLGDPPPHPVKLLSIDDSYLVAAEFRIESADE